MLAALKERGCVELSLGKVDGADLQDVHSLEHLLQHNLRISCVGSKLSMEAYFDSFTFLGTSSGCPTEHRNVSSSWFALCFGRCFDRHI
jgi:hypothetical protein